MRDSKEKKKMSRTFVATLAEHLLSFDLLVYQPEGMDVPGKVAQDSLLRVRTSAEIQKRKGFRHDE